MPVQSSEKRLADDSPNRHRPRGVSKRRITGWLRPLLGIVALAAIGMGSSRVHVPSTVRSYARIASAHEWILARGQDGQLIASTFNYVTGLNEGYRVSHFGSSVYFAMHPSIVPGHVVAIGDTVGSVHSSEMQERLIALNGQLVAARGLMAVNATGQKEAVVDEARQRLQFAKRKKEEHRRVLDRSRRLLEASLISQGEYENVESEANRLTDEIKIAEANLEAARTGAKAEQLDLAQANITAIENEIAAIRSRAATYTLTAPIAGTITRASSSDTLLTISDTTSYVALIPVKWMDYSRVATRPMPRLKVMGGARSILGQVIALGTEMQLLQGQQVVMATALLEGSGEALMPGMLAKCCIECQRVTVFEYVKGLLKTLAA